jgi:hypothetical protein
MVTLDQVYAEVLRLAQLVEAREASRLSRADLDRLGGLLPVVAAVFGSEAFLVRELLQADHAGLALVLAGCSGRSLGRLLRRGEGVPVGGYVVERLGQEGGAVLWRVVKVVS